MTDQQALAAYARERDAAAFALLVQRYQQLVYAACRRRLVREADVQDAVQQTFLRLARHSGAISTSLANWLYTCAMHVAVDMTRADAGRRRRELAWAERLPSAEERREQEALFVAVDEAMLDLAPPDRELIVEHYLHGQTQTALAQQADLTPAGVKWRLDRAVERLRAILRTRGVDVPAVAIATFAAADAASATVPAALTSELTKIGVAGIGTPPPSPQPFLHLKGLIHMATATPKAKAVTASLTAALLCGAVGSVYLAARAGAEPPATMMPTADKPWAQSVWAKDRAVPLAQGRLVTAGGVLHLVGHDLGKLVHRSSADGGRTWSEASVVSSNAQEYPMMYGGLAAADDTLYLLTADGFMGGEARPLDVRVSRDGGRSWQPRVRITDDAHKVYRGQLVVSGHHVHVVGMADPKPSGKVLYFHSSDGGKTWDPPRVLADNLGPYGGGQSLAASGSTVHVVYTKVTTGVGAGETCYLRSADDGRTWAAPQVIGERAADSDRQARVLIAAAGDHLFTIWQRETLTAGGPLPDQRLGYNRSTDGGVTWAGPAILPGEPGERDHPLLAMTSGGTVHLVWRQGSEEAAPVGYIRGSDFGATWDRPQIIFNPGQPNQVAAITADDATVHVLNGATVLSAPAKRP